MRILQLTDIHFESYPFAEDDKKSAILIEKLVDYYNPDLLAITGDLLWQVNRRTLAVAEGVLSFLDRLETPFAIAWGNHDSEFDYDRSTLNALVKNTKNHVVKENLRTVEGRELYTVDVGDKNMLLFLDSGDYNDLGIGEYAFILPEQIQDVVELAPKEGKTGYLFMHIPLVEYNDAKRLGLAIGNQDEFISSPQLNTGLYSALKIKSHVKNIFVGHDHDNDFSSQYHGIGLFYGRVTGYNAYGKLKRGGRIIDIDENIFDTFIVEDDFS